MTRRPSRHRKRIVFVRPQSLALHGAEIEHRLPSRAKQIKVGGGIEGRRIPPRPGSKPFDPGPGEDGSDRGGMGFGG